ncbi:MAG: RIP metalloprotease RseP [Anaerolineae bacterium]|nr:RIP metalloprotease RseP [Anaerolineae bacterium]
MNDFVLGIAAFGLVLIPLVVIHEFGHFIAAKLSGITVLEFGIGFPPRAATLFTRGDTIYTLNWLPIGGFVRPYGEDFVRPKTEDEMSADQEEIIERGIKNPKSVFQAGPWQRIFFMAAGPGINFVTALVLFIIIALIGWPYNRADVTVYEILPGSPAAQAGLQEGDVIRELNGAAVEEADEFNNALRDNADAPVSLLVERDGDQFEISLVASVVESADIERPYITDIIQGMPAEDVFELEDVIVAVDGIEITSIQQLQDYTQAHEGEEVVVTILRDGQTLDVTLAPRKDSEGVVRMGIQITGLKPAIIGLTAINEHTERYTKTLPPGKAIQRGTEEFVDLHLLIFEFVGDIFSGDISPSAARPVSPVGIGQLGAPVLDQSLDEGAMYPIVFFAALISISLALTNLLPIPGLDGGRILFVVVELIRGKPMEPEREGLIHFIGIMLLLGLIALTLVNDIINPIDVSNLR